MNPETRRSTSPDRRILSRVSPQVFTGRSEALDRIIRLGRQARGRECLLLLSTPLAGTSELLRQSFDNLFESQKEVSPVYYQWSLKDPSLSSAAGRFFRSFLLQILSHRQGNAALTRLAPSLNELLKLASAGDFAWVEELLRNYHQALGEGEHQFVEFCFSLPDKVAQQGIATTLLFDDTHLMRRIRKSVWIPEGSSRHEWDGEQTAVVFAGLRRQLMESVYGSAELSPPFENTSVFHLERLNDDDSRSLITTLADSRKVAINDETRDLLVRQCSGSPAYITGLIEAAHRSGRSLTSFLSCQTQYVEELFGGAINRRFNARLSEITSDINGKLSLLRILWDSVNAPGARLPLELWVKRLNLPEHDLRRVLEGLHATELASLNGAFVRVGEDVVWRDYLRSAYRLEVAAEPRTLVFAQTLTEALKNAPQSLARQYRRASSLDLRDTLNRFDDQKIPSSLLRYDQFIAAYKGLGPEEITTGLESETGLISLPKVVHVSSCAALHPLMQSIFDDHNCMVAHAFESGSYTDVSEMVWLAADLSSEGPAGRAITEMWCDRLIKLARLCEFNRIRLWLLSAGGFTSEASSLLNGLDAFSSSREQWESLVSCLGRELRTRPEHDYRKEYEMTIPISTDTEIIAAHTIEQIARRSGFSPEAINQIKTAVVEACINAAEHSFSPDGKIYQRFLMESDRLIISISSRGLAISPEYSQDGTQLACSPRDFVTESRRGWGLKLIRALMDEVEFERVDDGTRLRMTKYLHP